MENFYCKKCKKNVQAIDVWYLFPNREFENRVALIGKCSKCKSDVILLSEQRKIDGKIFNQLEVGLKAEHIAELIINQINITKDDIQNPKGVPYRYTYGTFIKNTKEKCYIIYRNDFYGNKEKIGIIPFDSSRII